MAKQHRSARGASSVPPPPASLGPGDILRATYYRAMRAQSRPVLGPVADAPDTTAVAQRLAADTGSLRARWQPLRSAAKTRAQ